MLQTLAPDLHIMFCKLDTFNLDIYCVTLIFDKIS